MIHCDIKSQNVLLTAGLDTAKIADVGVAQLLGAWDPDNIGWTFAYAAPELLLGSNITSKVRLAQGRGSDRDLRSDKLSSMHLIPFSEGVAAARARHVSRGHEMRCKTWDDDD